MRRRCRRDSVRDVLAAAVGGLGGALAGGLLVRWLDIKPGVVAGGVAAMGGIGALALEGAWQSAALGVCAGGAGQLVHGWLHVEAVHAEARNLAAAALIGEGGDDETEEDHERVVVEFAEDDEATDDVDPDDNTADVIQDMRNARPPAPAALKPWQQLRKWSPFALIVSVIALGPWLLGRVLEV